MSKTKARDNKLWVGMYVKENNNAEKQRPVSYRMKVQERDRLKLEREADQWARSSTTHRI